MRTLVLERSNKNKTLNCFWERFEKNEEFNEIEVVCDKYGKRKNAVYIRHQPEYDGDCRTALIPVNLEDFVISISYEKEEHTINFEVWQIDSIELIEDKNVLEFSEIIAECSEVETIPKCMFEVISTIKLKIKNQFKGYPKPVYVKYDFINWYTKNSN